jgi:hypothetical protein
LVIGNDGGGTASETDFDASGWMSQLNLAPGACALQVLDPSGNVHGCIYFDSLDNTHIGNTFAGGMIGVSQGCLTLTDASNSGLTSDGSGNIRFGQSLEDGNGNIILSQTDGTGVGLGASAVCSTYGTALGMNAYAANYGTAVGGNALGQNSGVAVGINTVALGTGNVAIGSASGNPGDGSHGACVASGLTDTTEIGRGTATQNGCLHYRGVAITYTNGEPILHSPNGTAYYLKVSNAGVLSASTTP